jgi:peroxiredoxin
VRKASILTLLILLALAACKSSDAPKQAGAIGPDFRAQDLTGRTRYLSAELTKPVILVFFATWCKPCRLEIPHLIELHKKIADKATILSLVVDSENVDKVRELASGLSIPYPMLLDEGGKIMEQYKVTELPATFLIGRDSTILSRYTHFGAPEVQELAARIESIGENR